MIKKYIRGNANRGSEVIKALTDLGGVNAAQLTGTRNNSFYYLNEYNEITFNYDDSTIGCILSECYEEITLPKQKEERFNPKTLKSFDRILVRLNDEMFWECDILSHIDSYKIATCIGGRYEHFIPYNDDTKHLVGTTEDAPEFYRWWENEV